MPLWLHVRVGDENDDGSAGNVGIGTGAGEGRGGTTSTGVDPSVDPRSLTEAWGGATSEEPLRALSKMRSPKACQWKRAVQILSVRPYKTHRVG